MEWQTDEPKEEGYYWAKYSKELFGNITLVYLVPEHTHVKIVGDEQGEHKSWFTHWLGPLPEPEAPK